MNGFNNTYATQNQKITQWVFAACKESRFQRALCVTSNTNAGDTDGN